MPTAPLPVSPCPQRWDVLGSAAGATAAKAHHHSLALDAADGGRPYLAALEGPGYNLTVRKYVSKEAGWQALPQPSGSGAAGYVALLMHPTQPGRPWVSWALPVLATRVCLCVPARVLYERRWQSHRRYKCCSWAAGAGALPRRTP